MEANAADAGCISAETLAQLIQDSFDQYLEVRYHGQVAPRYGSCAAERLPRHALL